jgi:V/A-type H+-transporting ATPase subunit I
MPFLRPVAMEKIGVVALKTDREAVLSVLHDLGVLQVEPMRKEALQIVGAETAPERARTVADELLRFRGLKAALPPIPVGSPRSFDSLEGLLEAAHRVPIVDTVAHLKREEDHLTTERKSLVDDIELLRRFAFYGDRLELLRLQHVLGFFGEVDAEAYPGLRSDIQAAADVLFLEFPTAETVRFVAVVNAAKAEAVARIAQQKGVQLIAAPTHAGTIPEVVPRLERRRAEVDARLAEIREELRRIAQEWYGPVATIEEALSIENRKFEIWNRLGAGHGFFAVEGWLPKRSRATVERDLRAVTADRAIVYRVPTREEPPTMLDNPRGIRFFEFFIRFYALPQATEWDPTGVFAFAFPIFFGFMLADVGYGLVILLISIWMLAGFPGGRYVPRPLRNFLKLIMSPKSMQSLAWTLLPGAALAIVLGWFSDEMFGPLGSWWTPFHFPGHFLDPLHSPGVLFLASGFIGLLMVTLGFVLGALKDYFLHHGRHALQRVGGIFMAWGLAFLGLQLVSVTFQHLLGVAWPAASAPPPAEYVEIATIVGGLLLIFAVEGGQGLIALTEIMSHVLSYLRLIGILVSSVVIALLITIIAQMARALPGALGLFAAIVVIVGGTMFNVVLGVFEPGIQGARLIFVEFFSKFYSGNGRPFRPFGSAREHTLPSRIPTDSTPPSF